MTSPFADPMRVFYGQLEVTDWPYGFEFGAQFGAGENVYEALAGLLGDGESVTSTRTSNREFEFVVWVEAPTLEQVEDPETALIAEAERPRNELTIHPGDGATPFVLETFRAQVEHDRSEDAERAGMRRFVLTVKALPFARSVNPTLSEVIASPPPPAAPIIVTVDDCNSTAGWSALPAPITHASGYVYNTTWAPGRYRATLTRAGSVDMTTTPYLIVEWHRSKRDWTPIWTPPVLNYTTQEGPLTAQFWVRPVQTKIIDKTWAQSIYILPAQVLPRLEFTASTMHRSEDHRLHIRNIERSDQMPAPRATGHQASRSITVGGSARTQATMHLWHDSDPLGDTLIYTSSTLNGMFSCDAFLTSTAVSAGGTVSSTGKSMASPVMYEVPASLFNPDVSTGYLIMARLQREGTGAITTEVDPIIGDPFGTGVIAIAGGEQNTIRPPSMTGQTFVCLGAFNLPPRRVDSEDAAVRVTVTLDSPTGTPVLDDLWMVDIETGSLTWVNGNLNGDPTSANLAWGHMWVEPPSLDAPLPRVRTAHDVYGRYGYEMFPSALGKHDFPPGDVHVYSVSTTATESKIQLEYYERWRLNAGG